MHVAALQQAVTEVLHVPFFCGRRDVGGSIELSPREWPSTQRG